MFTGITPQKTQKLAQDFARLGIRESDLTEEFIRGSGAGGQKINKTSSTVVLTHLPSGFSVKCQHTRSQSQNRYWARRILVEKIEGKILGEKSQKRQEIEKIRRQKRKKSRRAKNKMLDAKKHQGEKKKSRSRLNFE